MRRSIDNNGEQVAERNPCPGGWCAVHRRHHAEPMDLNAPQPPPTAGDGDAVWPSIYDSTALVLPDWLRADMRERHELGVKKYGTPLRVWNGRDPVVDAYQEALDLVVYTQQARARLEALSLRKLATSTPSSTLNVRLTLDLAFHNALQIACHLGELARLQQVPTTKEGRR